MPERCVRCGWPTPFAGPFYTVECASRGHHWGRAKEPLCGAEGVIAWVGEGNDFNEDVVCVLPKGHEGDHMGALGAAFLGEA